MNRSYRLIFSLLSSLLFLPAITYACGTFEIRGAAFFPAKEEIRERYGNVNGSYGVEAAIDIPWNSSLWINFDQFSKHSKANEAYRSQMSLSTFSIGLKRSVCLNDWASAYLGLGVTLSSVYFKQCGDDDWTSKRRGSVGGVVKSGLIVDLCYDFFIDVFADYYYQPVRYHHRTSNVGGLRTGAGLGYRF